MTTMAAVSGSAFTPPADYDPRAALALGWGHRLRVGDWVAAFPDGALLTDFPVDGDPVWLRKVAAVTDSGFGRHVTFEDGGKVVFLGDPEEGFVGDEAPVVYSNWVRDLCRRYAIPGWRDQRR